LRDLTELSQTLNVEVRELPLKKVRGLYQSSERIIIISSRLTEPQRYTTWAHELGHAFYDDTATACPDQHDFQERRATAWAAITCISVHDYAEAEHMCGPHAGAIAQYLNVTRELVTAWQQNFEATLRRAG
jgi:Zn-dependent peptidase ImmA (M78 family)